MILAVVLAALLLCFLLVKHNVGVPFLAMIAGLAVYEAFGASFAATINTWIPTCSEILAQHILYGLFVLLIPILLYFRAGKSGLFGILRVIESVIFGAMLTILASGILTYYFSFDTMAVDIANWLDGIRGYIMVAGIILAYVDVFFYRSGQSFWVPIAQCRPQPKR